MRDNDALIVKQGVEPDRSGPLVSGYMQLGDIVSVFCPECRHENPVDENLHVQTISGLRWHCEACGHEWQFPEMKAWHVVEEES